MFRGNLMTTTTTGIVCIEHFFFTTAEASVEAEEKALSLLISTSVGKACLTRNIFVFRKCIVVSVSLLLVSSVLF